MAQISRPYQIAVVAVICLGLAWVLFLHSHGSSESTSSPSPGSTPPAKSASQPSGSSSSGSLASAEAKQAAGPTPVYKGAAPGVEGLTRAVAKAHAAVATSQQNAKEFEGASAEASSRPQSTVAAPSTSAGAGAAARATAHAAAPAAAKASAAPHATKQIAEAKTLAHTNAVEAELRAGKTVLILFWNPLGSADRAVRGQVQAVTGKAKGRVSAHYALADEVATFGSITRSISVYQTPTLLVIGANRQVTTLLGLPDAYGIEQAIQEIRH